MDYLLYALIAPATLAILAITQTRAWRYRANRQASVLLVSISLNIGWLIINYLELVVLEPSAKIIFAKSGYLFIGMICVVWLIFAMRYTGLERFIKPYRVVLALLPWATSVILVFTNEWHGLIWSVYNITDLGNGLTAIRILKYGAAFWPLTLYNWILTLTGFALLLNKFLRSSPLFRRQTIWILAGATLPLALNLVYVLRIIPNFNKDYTPVGFGVGVLMLAISILRFHLFELAPVARETLVDQLGDGMLVLDSLQRVVDSNPAAGQLLDCSTRLVGINAGQLFPELPNFGEHLPHQPNLPVELQYQSPAGRALKLRIWGLSGNSTHANGWLILMQDVSATQQALADLRKSEELFRSVVHSAQEGVAIIDLQGNITYVSPRMLEMFGYNSIQELIGKQLYEFINQPELPRVAASLQRLISGEKLDGAIFQHTRKDGLNFYGESLGAVLRNPDGQPYSIILLVRDISARLAAESERTRMAQILQTVIDNENIILTSFNQERKIVLWNKGAEKITGYSAAEALTFDKGYPDPSYRQQMLDVHRRARKGETVNIQVELTARSGEKKYIAMVSRSLLDEQGDAIGVVNVGLDITSHIHHEQATQSLNTNLEELIAQRTMELQNTVRHREDEIRARRQAESELVIVQENLANRLSEQGRQLAALYEVIITGGQSLEWQALLNNLLEKILAVTNGAAGAIYQSNSKSHSLQMLAQHGLSAEAENVLQNIPEGWTKLNENQTSKLEACLNAPIHLRGEITGALCIWHESSRRFSIEDVALSNALADQVGIIMENSRLRSQIQQTAVQNERQRIARDLHDSVTQSLHSLTWLTDVALNRLKQGNPQKLEQSLHQITDSARQALKEMRLLLYESLLQATAELPLVEALTLRLEAVEQRAGLQTQLDIEHEKEWPNEWDPELFAIAIEALNNALKYARASQMTIRLRGGHTWCQMDIEDNGIGFDPQRTPSGGIGLRNMRERAAALGGNLDIDSIPQEGTHVHVSIGHPSDFTPEEGK